MRYSKTPPTLVLSGETSKRRPQRTPGRIHSVRKRLGPDAIQQLVIHYEAGQSTAALTEAYGLGKGTVLDILTEHGVKMRDQGPSD